jgi:hypothetical protein
VLNFQRTCSFLREPPDAECRELSQSVACSTEPPAENLELVALPSGIQAAEATAPPFCEVHLNQWQEFASGLENIVRNAPRDQSECYRTLLHARFRSKQVIDAPSDAHGDRSVHHWRNLPHPALQGWANNPYPSVQNGPVLIGRDREILTCNPCTLM